MLWLLTLASDPVVDAAVTQFAAGGVAEARKTVAVGHPRSFHTTSVVLSLTAEVSRGAAVLVLRPSSLGVPDAASRCRQTAHGHCRTDGSNDTRHNQTPHLHRRLLAYTHEIVSHWNKLEGTVYRALGSYIKHLCSFHRCNKQFKNVKNAFLWKK